MKKFLALVAFLVACGSEKLPPGEGADTADTVDTGETADTGETTDTGDTADTATDTAEPVDTGDDCTDADGDGYCADVDCDDEDASVNPGATEICNDVDDDCDGSTDEGVTTHVYRDLDLDGYGDELGGTDTCGVPSGYTSRTGDMDCNDADASINPGASEICGDGIDQDCNEADEACPETDADGDGVSVEDGDCDDSNAEVHPGAAEVCDWIEDNNCDGILDSAETDSDGDGYTGCFMYHTQVDADGDGYCDGGVDNNHDGDCTDSGDIMYAEDETAPDSVIDCDLTDATIYPGATEIWGDGIDQDCDGSDSSLAKLQDAATCSSGQEACFRDVDGDGSYETLLMVTTQLYGMPASASVYENGYGTGCGIDGETADVNAGGYYVVSFEGMSSCTSQVSLTSGGYWWQNYSFCTDGSDTQGICVNTGGYNYLLEIDYRSTSGLQF